MELSKWLKMPVRCSFLLTMRCNPNIAQRKQLKQEDTIYLKEAKYPGLSNSVPSIPIKSFLTSLEEGSKYGLKLNVSNLKIIENTDTLVLEMRNMDLEGIEDLLIQTLGTVLERKDGIGIDLSVSFTLYRDGHLFFKIL
jgi:lipopolysaccharide biosynthesis protein